MSENKVVGIVEAHKATAERGETINFAEKLARDIVSGKIQTSVAAYTKSVNYILEVDKLKKIQRFAAVNERRKLRHEEKAEESKAESVITPELAKRLANLGDK